MARSRLCPIFMGLPAAALAQTGSLTWQANDGSGWTSGSLVTDSPTVRIRLLAEWDIDSEYTAFGATQFDGRISTDFVAADTIADFGSGFDPFNRQAFPVATRMGTVLKLDDRRDSLPPGQGPYWTRCGQVPEAFQWVVFDNPLDILSFTITFDGVPGTRTIDLIPGLITGGNTIDRVMYIYIDRVGNRVFPLTTISDLRITYIPTPGALPLLALALIPRRRR